MDPRPTDAARQPARIAVIGVGNEFRRDDGVGWAVIRRLRERAARRPLPPGVVLRASDGEPGRLIGLWEATALAVVVDAVRTPGGSPGRVHRLEAGDPDLRGAHSATSHGLGLGEAVELARTLGRLPRRLVLYAVEAADTSLGAGLTPALEAAVPSLAGRVEDDVRSHAAARALAEACTPSAPPAFG
ncbi:hydrogenase maturation protease [Streptomyces sp. HNM0663]|uniref:Hydrogenase maturation protease n=1 Tax=Streptomyces chengmaiensis TaxID=3040919 RepID=A0ABT6HGM1_9ACTN|nr:hydrogenase maturation protease [Streptomyces chengmaiensis]MDH2387914.1 hydrogenase maturation protease [Streptomyces chengmaiensis]